MDLLPAETSKIVKKKHGFRSLKLVNVDMDQVLGAQPVGVDYGRLDNGLCYYVRCNSKPRMRAALALAVKVGYNFFFVYNWVCFSLSLLLLCIWSLIGVTWAIVFLCLI